MHFGFISGLPTDFAAGNFKKRGESISLSSGKMVGVRAVVN
jgi:hypothetical protein